MTRDQALEELAALLAGRLTGALAQERAGVDLDIGHELAVRALEWAEKQGLQFD